MELSPSDVNINPVNKKSQPVSLPPTGPPVMLDVNPKAFVAGNMNRSEVDLSFAARNAY